MGGAQCNVDTSTEHILEAVGTLATGNMLSGTCRAVVERCSGRTSTGSADGMALSDDSSASGDANKDGVSALDDRTALSEHSLHPASVMLALEAAIRVNYTALLELLPGLDYAVPARIKSESIADSDSEADAEVADAADGDEEAPLYIPPR